MSAKEAKARIKINKFLEDAGWRFFDSPEGRANVVLEGHVTIIKPRKDSKILIATKCAVLIRPLLAG
jgi:type I restriction enzyme R subunit